VTDFQGQKQCSICGTLRDLDWFPEPGPFGEQRACLGCRGGQKRYGVPRAKRPKPPGRASARLRRKRLALIEERAEALR
jgi:hypothetical protein